MLFSASWGCPETQLLKGLSPSCSVLAYRPEGAASRGYLEHVGSQASSNKALDV